MTTPNTTASGATAPDTPAPVVVVDPSRRMRSLIVLGCLTIVIVALDQLTKHWVVTTIRPRLISGEGPIVLLGGLVKFTYAENTGAAFSMGTGYTWIFSVIAIAVIAVIIRSARRLGSVWWAVALAGMLGGSLGNLIDRMTRVPGPGRGYVVDFIQLPHYAIFNVADSCIVGAGVLMVILALRNVPFSGPTS